MQAYLDYPIHPGPLRVDSVKVMQGANYFSAGPVVVFRLDLGAYDEVFTRSIPGFFERLRTALPSLVEHHCSVGKRGGFFQRVEEGTLLGHVMEHVAIELQHLAGMEVSYGKTRSTLEQGVYNVVFRFFDEVAGVYAGKAAVNLLNALLEHRDFDVAGAVVSLVDIRETRMLGPSTQAIVNEARRRYIPTLRLDAFNLVQLGTGKYLKRIRATLTSDAGTIAVESVHDKLMALRVLRDAGMPMPETLETQTLADAIAFRQRLGAPIVLKPREGNRGRGVSLYLDTEAEIDAAFRWAQQCDTRILVQPHLVGETYRLLVIGGQLAAAARLDPPAVVGDGVRSITQLVEGLNGDPRRALGDKTELTWVELDEVTAHILAVRGLEPGSVLPPGERLVLKSSGNLALGGAATDVTEQVHPLNRFMAERAVKVMGLDIASVEVVCPDITRSILETGGACIEIHAAPDFRPHLMPASGEGRNVARPFVDLLFPDGQPTHMPVFSVTGTAGKTTTVHLLAHCLARVGYTPGLTTTDGLYVAGRCLMEGDMTFPEQVGLVLKDPTLDCAVLETSREGILRRGLGYEHADIGIVLNMHGDHVGADDIKYIEDLAYAKSVVAEQLFPKGCAVLNADQDLVYEMRERVDAHLALFSQDSRSPRIQKHVQQGGLAVVREDGHYLVLRPHERIPVASVEEVPLTRGGWARVNDDNIMATISALYAFGMSVDAIREGLRSFVPGPDTLPGRMNSIPMGGFEVLVDYAHNRIGFEMMRDFLARWEGRKLGVLDAAGDRSDDEIRELGALAAQTYQEVHLYEDPNLRGRTKGTIVALLTEGLLASGFPRERIQVFEDPVSATAAALRKGEHGMMIVVLSERSRAVLKTIRDHLELWTTI